MHHMQAVRAILSDSDEAMPASAIARLAGVQIERAYLELVALESLGVARVIVSNPHRGRAECLWSAATDRKRTWSGVNE